MKLRIALFVSCFAAASVAHAQVYKCAAPGGAIEYQSTPCPAASAQKSVRIANDAPTESAARQARISAERAKLGAAQLDLEYERRQQHAMAEASRRQAEKDRKAERCARYEARAEELNKRSETWYTKRYKNEDRANAKALNDRHFSECFGSR